MFKLKNRYKLLLFTAVLLILIAGVYASFEPPIAPLSDLTNSNVLDSFSQNSESSRRENNLASADKTDTCLTCNDTRTLTKTIENYLTCQACAGAGKIICPYCSGSGHLGASGHSGADICPECLGTGRQTCHDCDGKGYKSETVITKEKCPTCKDKATI